MTYTGSYTGAYLPTLNLTYKNLVVQDTVENKLVHFYSRQSTPNETMLNFSNNMTECRRAVLFKDFDNYCINGCKSCHCIRACL